MAIHGCADSWLTGVCARHLPCCTCRTMEGSNFPKAKSDLLALLRGKKEQAARVEALMVQAGQEQAVAEARQGLAYIGVTTATAANTFSEASFSTAGELYKLASFTLAVEGACVAGTPVEA